jgi:hypothetical protein
MISTSFSLPTSPTKVGDLSVISARGIGLWYKETIDDEQK